MSFNQREFRNALGCFPTGVTIITSRTVDGTPIGVTINSFTSLSLEPPLVLFCLDNRTPCLTAIRAFGHFAVNVLADDQKALSVRFSTRMEDKWSGIERLEWDTGIPILDGCLANLECSIIAVHDGGDHQIFVGRVGRFAYASTRRPLLYYRGNYADLG